jgi:Ras-related protein Rab-21
MSEDNIVKIVILGEGRVGKTSILSKYFNKKFDSSQKSTVNPSYFEKSVTHNGKIFKLNFWDTAGQEQFNAISHIYYQNAKGALLVYDVTIFETFQKVKSWVNTLQEVVGKNITFLIAGNKFDLSDKNTLDKNISEINAYCSQMSCKHMYTSAKTGFNLEEAFESLIKDVLNKVCSSKEGGTQRRGKRIEIASQEVDNNKKKGCC